MKQRWRILIGLAMSLLFFVWALWRVQWGEFWESLRGANYLYLAPAALLIVLVSWVRAYRWRLLMSRDAQLSLLRTFHFVNIGYFFNNILPAKAGEVVRGYLAGRAISGGFGQAVSSLLIERLLDVLSVVVLLLILLPVVALPAWIMRGGLLFGGAAIAGAIALFVLSRFGTRGVDWVWRWAGRVPMVGGPRFKKALLSLVKGFGVITSGKLLPGVLLGTALVWSGYALFNYTVMAAFGLSYLPFASAALVLCATGLAMVLPSSPGAIGVFEKAGMAALALYGVGESLAFSAILVLHLFTNVILILLGLAGLMAEGLSYGRLSREAIASAPEAEGHLGGEAPVSQRQENHPSGASPR
jgi:hypothetical protein